MKNEQRYNILLIMSLTLIYFCISACEETAAPKNEPLKPTLATTQVQAVRSGAEVLLSDSQHLIQGKSIAVVANHTSLLSGGKHLVDALVEGGFDVKTVFAPEHGFRGKADAGEHVESGKDKRTGLPIISLYGKNRKPSAEQLANVEVVLFDIQDVGARFYTYISTMAYVMETCAESGKSIIILDRPNPNGWYVDGPMMEDFHSFIGMHKIPIAHGMTVGEYAKMLVGEEWIKNAQKLDLQVVMADHYTHKMRWAETQMKWTPPSPNLATPLSAHLYTAICWLEPTDVSLGRGTDSAFTIMGAPWFKMPELMAAKGAGLQMLACTFTPRSLPGKSKYPKHENKDCHGFRFQGRAATSRELFIMGIEQFQDFYQQSGMKENFFKKNFEKWPGYSDFRQQIMDGISAEEIYDSWQPKTNGFREMRKKYLMYDDF